MELNLNIQREYVGGYQTDKGALRKYKYTSESKNERLNGLEFFSETYTKKKRGMDYGGWGKSETHFYLEDYEEMFDSIHDLVEFYLKKMQ